MKKLAEIIATAFYVGYAPVVPATFGSALGATLFWFFVPRSIAAESVVTVVAIVVAIIASGKAEEKFGRDGKRIVIDEVAGMFMSLCFLPREVPVFVVAFVVFRVFDILKPFPANRLQKLNGGWGVTADDVFAGIYTNVLVQILLVVRGALVHARP